MKIRTMTLPQIISELLTLLFDLAAPAAICTMVLAGLALRQEGGVNFQMGGNFQKWIVWSAILLTLPQLLSWFAAQGIVLPPQSGGAGGGWVSAMETSFKNFVSGFVVSHLIPVVASFCVLKAALDVAQGQSPLPSVIAAIFMLSVSTTTQLMQGWNSGSQFATTDMLVSAWNFLAGHILPEAAGLAVVGAIINYVRHRPVASLITSALAFLSISAIWKLVQTMVGA
jgi:hypothetical protein